MTNLANAVTSLRLVLLPVALFFFMKNDLWSNVVSLLLVIIMEFSDLFDGMIARKFKSVSNLGKILDPFADHIYRISFFLFFAIKEFIPLWMFLICFYRDSIVMNLRIFAAKQENTFVAARSSGKKKAIAQSTAIILFIFLQIVNYRFRIVNLDKIYFLVMFVVAAVTLWSALDYTLGIMHWQRRYLNASCLVLSLLALLFIIVQGDYHRVIFQPSNVFSWKEQLNLRKLLPEYSPGAIAGDNGRVFLTVHKRNAPTILAIIRPGERRILKRIEIPALYGKISSMGFHAGRLWMIDNERGRMIGVDVERSLHSGFLEVQDEGETGVKGVNGLAFVSVDGRVYLALSVHLKEGRTYLADFARWRKSGAFRESVRSQINNYNFSQGLAFDGTYLYDANSYFGYDRIFKVDLRKAMANESYNGSVVEVFNSPDQMIKGVFISGNDIWTVDEFSLKLYKGTLRK